MKKRQAIKIMRECEGLDYHEYHARRKRRFVYLLWKAIARLHLHWSILSPITIFIEEDIKGNKVFINKKDESNS